MDFTQNSGGGCGTSCATCSFKTNKKLLVMDWLSDLPESTYETNLVEVQFKNTRKAFFQNVNKLDLKRGDMVAVEASPGHDIGEVTLTGRLAMKQMEKNSIDPSKYETRKIYRIARDVDMEKYHEAKAKEQETMIKARQIAAGLNLNMKIGDVEFQGDGNKAIFYYIADERVDFRQLIKVFAETFRVRIEMKQIGARQEAGRIGGIGSCGRELCCSGWMTNFNSVSTSAARYQDLSLNPQKLAGQCGKLKCCLNFELDSYLDAQKDLPSREIELESKEGIYYHFKTDIFKGQISYSTDRNIPANLVTITADRAKYIIALNKKGQKPDVLTEVAHVQREAQYENVVGQDSLTRFDAIKGPKRKRKPAGPRKDDRRRGNQNTKDN